VTSPEDLRHNIDDRIDQYVNGKLSQDQIDEIWIDALCDERHYSYLRSSSYLKDYFTPKTIKAEVPEFAPTTTESPDNLNIIIAAIIAAILFAALIFWGMN
jgi:hypothetical protein